MVKVRRLTFGFERESLGNREGRAQALRTAPYPQLRLLRLLKASQ